MSADNSQLCYFPPLAIYSLSWINCENTEINSVSIYMCLNHEDVLIFKLPILLAFGYSILHSLEQELLLDAV